MRTKPVKIAVATVLGAILIIGSFVTDNFGISEAYVGWTSPKPVIVGEYTFYPGIEYLLSPRSPYPNQFWAIYDGTPPNKTAITMLSLGALVLLYAYFIFVPSRRRKAVQYQQAEVTQAPWKSPIKKHKYKSRPTFKKHPSYATHNAQRNLA